MWHWRPNWQLKKHELFWLKLVGISFAGHLLLLALGFYTHRKDHVNLTVFAKPRAIEVVFMPLYKKAPRVQSKVQQASVAATGARVKTSTQKTAPVIKQVPDKKVAAPKSKNKPVPAKKMPVKKVPAKTASKKTELKLKEQAVKLKPELSPIAPLAPAASIEPVASEPIYIGRADLKDLQMFTELQAVLLKNWQPPTGFGTEVECVVELVVGPEGEIMQLEIKKSSNILAYDLSVRRNFHDMVLPKIAANKTFTIVFKP